MLRYLVDGGPYVVATLSELQADQRSGQLAPRMARNSDRFPRSSGQCRSCAAGLIDCAADEIGVEDEHVNTVADAIARGIPRRLAARRR